MIPFMDLNKWIHAIRSCSSGILIMELYGPIYGDPESVFDIQK